MSDLTNLPADITAEDFFYEHLAEELAEVELPDGLGADRMQFNVTGDEGIELHIGIDEDGDLTIEEGQADAPPIAVTTSWDHFYSMIAGELRDRIREVTGGFELTPRHLRRTFLPEAKVQQIKGLSGDIQVKIHDADTGEDTVVTATLGGGAPNLDSPSCSVGLDVPTLLEIASGRQNPQQLFMAGQVRIDGDMGVVLGLVGILSAR